MPPSRSRRIGAIVCLVAFCGLAFGGATFTAGLLLGKRQAAPRVRGKSLNFYKQRSEEAVVPAAVQNPNGSVPGEFEHQAAIMIGANEMLAYHPRTFVQMVAALCKKMKVMGLIWSEEQRTEAEALLKADNLPEDSVDFYVWPAISMWVRDYGPFFVMESKNGPAHIVDYAYTQPNRDYGDLFSSSFASTFGYEFSRAGLSIEGGQSAVERRRAVRDDEHRGRAKCLPRIRRTANWKHPGEQFSIQELDASQAAGWGADPPRRHVLHDLRDQPRRRRQLHATSRTPRMPTFSTKTRSRSPRTRPPRAPCRLPASRCRNIATEIGAPTRT